MSAFVSACDALKADTGATVLLVHHCGLSDKTRSRGNMALKAALDAEYRLDKDADWRIRFEATKMKDSIEPEPAAFSPPLWKSETLTGSWLLLLCLIALLMTPRHKKVRREKANGRPLLWKLYRTLEKEHADRLESAGFNPDTRLSVSVDDWRDACAKRGLNDRRIWKKVKELS